MTPVIHQTVRFRAGPHVLFEQYADSHKHSQARGVPARISRETGPRFTAFVGSLEGRNLVVVPARQVVQFWRATHWKGRLVSPHQYVLPGRRRPRGGCRSRGSSSVRSQRRPRRMAQILLAAVEDDSGDIVRERMEVGDRQLRFRSRKFKVQI